jgi:proteasome lid subunit RPN8/RPN11
MQIRNGDVIMENKELANNSIKDAIKMKIKEKIKKELLDEICEELKLEEEELTEEITSMLTNKSPAKPIIKHTKVPTVNIVEKISGDSNVEQEIQKEAYISVKAILKIASHALKYANSKIPRADWVEVIGLLGGRLDKNDILHIEDAYPMGHGTAVYAEIKDYKNYVRAFKDIKRQKLFTCGWYHSHPTFGCFMSREDMGTQERYQKLWDKAVALVIDPYLIDGTSTGFEIYRANLKSKTWYPLVYGINGSLDIRMLPDILSFMNPIIQGKPAYLEYDEE